MFLMKSPNEVYPLNALEKFMLMHESSDVVYNSQIAMNFQGTLDSNELYKAVLDAIRDIPLLRTQTTKGFWNFKRTVLNELRPSQNELIEAHDKPLSQEELDRFCMQKFDISRAQNFKFLMAPTLDGGNQIIFNIHHSLCDAAGHFMLLEEVFRILNGKEVREQARQNTAFRYRDLVKLLGIKWVLKKIWINRKSLKNQRQYKMATLVESPTLHERQVSSRTYHFSKEESLAMKTACRSEGLSLNEYLTKKSFEAFDDILKKNGDSQTPILAYIPKTLRPMLKIRFSFSNILSTVVVVGRRHEIATKEFSEKITKFVQGHKLEEASKFIFNTLLPCSIGRASSLKKIFRKMDKDPNASTSSMLVSTGKVPRSFEFPNHLSDIRIWARGTMLKSPGIGIILTGTHETESITVEFLKGLVSEHTAQGLYQMLIEKLCDQQNEQVFSKTILLSKDQQRSSNRQNILH